MQSGHVFHIVYGNSCRLGWLFSVHGHYNAKCICSLLTSCFCLSATTTISYRHSYLTSVHAHEALTASYRVQLCPSIVSASSWMRCGV